MDAKLNNVKGINDFIHLFQEMFLIEFKYYNKKILIIMNEKKNKDSNDNIKKIEILISSIPTFYEIKFYVKNKKKKDNNNHNSLVHTIKVDGDNNMYTIINDLKSIIQGECDSVFHPKYPL